MNSLQQCSGEYSEVTVKLNFNAGYHKKKKRKNLYASNPLTGFTKNDYFLQLKSKLTHLMLLKAKPKIQGTMTFTKTKT